MEDELNKPQELRAIAFEDIPTPEEHRREVRKIFTVCGSFGAVFLIAAVIGITIAVRSGVPLPVIAAVAVMSSFICIVTFGVSYACPVGLVSLRRLEIAYRMGYFGLGQHRDVAASMKQIAERVKRETTPLPSARRPSVEA
jgi:hypothetical protein